MKVKTETIYSSNLKLIESNLFSVERHHMIDLQFVGKQIAQKSESFHDHIDVLKSEWHFVLAIITLLDLI